MKHYIRLLNAKHFTLLLFFTFSLCRVCLAKEPLIKFKDTISLAKVPVYKKLKNLHLKTDLTINSKPAITIVAPTANIIEGRLIQKAIKQLTGITIPLVTDYPENTTNLIKENLILLGNRSTNQVINALYDKGYTFLDLKYPGPGGFVMRSLHNPFGNGKNVLFAGGSNAEGVKMATLALITAIKQAATYKGTLSVGYLCKIKPGKAFLIPDSTRNIETWEGSRKYGATGYFSWNSVSKNMAAYYMTNDEKYLKEFLRLSFPDQAAIKEMEQTDGELIENKSDPLSGPYHYAASMMVLMWDLIEESPSLSDDLRLKITNALSRQLEHRIKEYTSGYQNTKPAPFLGERHADWAAYSLYTLARYFDKDYPSLIWKHCLHAGDLYFSALKNTTWIGGHNDHLFWFTSYYDPMIDYLILTGNRDPQSLANLRHMLNTQEIISTGGNVDWGLETSSLSMLNKAAYILNDGRWLDYRKRTGLSTDVFRLGQSFWPAPQLKAVPPTDLTGKWKTEWMQKEMWEGRKSGFPLEQSFRWSSYRTETGPGGDYLLIKGYNGAGRNPYHSFNILELRLNGATLLKGYQNQVLTSEDGVWEPKVAMDSKLLYQGTVGQVSTAVAEVPDLPFANWKRTLSLRNSKYVLIADDLKFRKDSKSMLVQTKWDVRGPAWNPNTNALTITPLEPGKSGNILLTSEPMQVKTADVTQMDWLGSVKNGERKIFFHLIGSGHNGLSCIKLTDQAASLSLPEAALAVAGEYKETNGQLVILSEKTLYGHEMLKAGINIQLLLSNSPMDIDWDFQTGKLLIVNKAPLILTLALATPQLMVNGKPITAVKANTGYTINLPAGKQEISRAIPSPAILTAQKSLLQAALKNASELRAIAQKAETKTINPTPPILKSTFNAQLQKNPVSSITIPSAQGDMICTAAGNTITILNAEGSQVKQLNTIGSITTLRWWAEPKLLLVGCNDEKVIAFDEQGKKKWEFTSEMDSAVYKEGKQYWFKSVYPGIRGLYSGHFDKGKSRAFVGGACTLEILNEEGQLVKRMPVFWSVVKQFIMVEAKDGSKNLLLGGSQSGTNELIAINSSTLAETGRGYNAVPAGHAQVGGWMVMNRYDNFLCDLDQDGKKELISAINGSWNRVSTYTEDGKPLYNVQFGPGKTLPRTNLRMMDVGDINGDGKSEIVTALSSGIIYLMNSKSEKIWAKKLASPALVVKFIKQNTSTWLCIGSEDGTITAMDASGNILKEGKVAGKPTDLLVLQTSGGPMAVINTDIGGLTGFRLN